MKLNKNHEGYHDPTAGKAIRWASRKRRGVVNRDPLTYKLSEVTGFKKARRIIMRCDTVLILK